MSARVLSFVVPGDLGQRTGGYGYDREIISGLRQAGWVVDVVSLPGDFPWPGDQALSRAEALVAAIPDGRLVVADGLALGACPEIVHRHRHRLKWVALVHHPLALESGLSPDRAKALRESEGRALSAVNRTIATSAATARTLTESYGVPQSQVHVVEPGTAPTPLSRGSTPGSGLRLLCVGTLTPRKGHAVLIEALSGLRSHAWRLHCLGNLERDPLTTEAVRAALKHHGLSDRIQLHGEVDEATLEAHFDQADAFVLPSLHEGYGMALAEALARGLPILSTKAGAIPDTVPAEAALLVPPGDPMALRGALSRLLSEPALRLSLAQGARAARNRLHGWREATERFQQALPWPLSANPTREFTP